MKAIVTVIGKDKTGIIAAVSGELSRLNANIEDISQTVMRDYFVMMMMCDVSKSEEIASIAQKLTDLGKKIGVDIRIQHEDIFNSMHKV
ncbi:MAG: ACT domain-containing protein [Clostridiales bacterium]|jgi:ACT domain-containing protein|nr:ACT domain-containing protein [Clostridiales bacterium]